MESEISCRLTKTLLLYVREANGGSLGNLLDGLEVDEAYLMDVNQWVSHALLQNIYHRVIDVLADGKAIYKMALSSERFQSLGVLDRIVRLIGSPKLVYLAAPKYNKMLKLNGEVFIRDSGKDWVLLEDCYHDPGQKTCHDCDYTRGILAGIPTMFGLPLAQVEELHCQVGDVASRENRWPDDPQYNQEGCLFRVQWPQSAQKSWFTGLFTRRAVYQKAIDDLQTVNLEAQRKYQEASKLSTELDAANRELSASEKKYRLLAENVSDMIWTFSLAENRFTYMSPSVQKMCGYTVEEAMDMGLQDTLHPDSLTQTMGILQEELARDNEPGVDKKRSITLTVKLAVADGSYFWGEVMVSFIRDPDGLPVGLQGITRDISARQLAEDALKKSEANYRSIFETSGDYICLHDLQGKIMKINPAVARGSGLPVEAIVGKNVAQLIPSQDRSAFSSDYLQEIAEQGRAEGVTKMLGAGGRIHYIEYRNNLVRPDNEPPFVIAIGRDITERVQDKRELEQLQVQLLHSQKMQAVGTLAGGVAHDFNNIMQAISGCVYLMNGSNSLDDSNQRHLGEINAAVERAKSLVQQLLTFSRNVKPDFHTLNLNQEIHDALGMLERTIPKMITIEKSLDPDLGMVFGDAYQLGQVILNLGSNAKDAMPGGGLLKISTHNVAANAQLRRSYPELSVGTYALLTVRDQGVGIPPQVLKNIYDPFFTTKPIGQGTGLGLSTVFGIVKAHQGHIFCDSKLGEGTVFKVFFPTTGAAGRVEGLDRQSDTCAGPVGHGETILVVDDEETIVDTVGEVLAQCGYKVHKAHSGEAALQLTRSLGQKPSLVVLDLGMPGMGGMNCLAELQSLSPEIKVLIASGYSEHASEKHLLDSGAAGFIRKPFDMKSLISKTAELLEKPQP